ncbi:MAG: hypothetical protein NZ820_07095 [Dehalococcoidia bacterium]|nr:hypothetical protein [Dehalococcoidia bacterium]
MNESLDNNKVIQTLKKLDNDFLYDDNHHYIRGVMSEYIKGLSPIEMKRVADGLTRKVLQDEWLLLIKDCND